MTTHRMELGKRKIDNTFCLEQNAVNLERPTSGKRQAMKQLLKQEAEALLKVFQALPDNVHFRTPTLHLKGMLEQHVHRCQLASQLGHHLFCKRRTMQRVC